MIYIYVRNKKYSFFQAWNRFRFYQDERELIPFKKGTFQALLNTHVYIFCELFTRICGTTFQISKPSIFWGDRRKILMMARLHVAHPSRP